MASSPPPKDAHEEALAFFSDAHALNVEAMAQVIAQTRLVSPKLAAVLQQLDDAWSTKLLRRAMGKYRQQSSQTARIKDDIARLSDGCIGAFGEANRALLALSTRVTEQRSALTGHKAKARALERQLATLDDENARLTKLARGLRTGRQRQQREQEQEKEQEQEQQTQTQQEKKKNKKNAALMEEHEAVLERIHATMDTTFDELAKGTSQRRRLLRKVRERVATLQGAYTSAAKKVRKHHPAMASVGVQADVDAFLREGAVAPPPLPNELPLQGTHIPKELRACMEHHPRARCVFGLRELQRLCLEFLAFAAAAGKGKQLKRAATRRKLVGGQKQQKAAAARAEAQETVGCPFAF